MKQVNLFPDRAATFVVHPTPGIGDATTIQEALDMLPAGGGSLLVREGTYPLTVTITPPVGKPVSIRGCGNSTIISLGANAIPAFTIPTGAVTNTPIVFDNFQVTGTEVATQTFLEYADSNSLAEIYMENIVTVGVEVTINVTASGSSSSSPGVDDARFHMLRCRIRPNTTNNSIILSNPSLGYPRCWMTEVEFIGDSLFAVPGGHTGPLFGRIADDLWFGDLSMDSCEMSVGTDESDFAALECVNTTVWNNDPVNKLVQFFIFGSFDGFNPGTISSSMFRGVYLQGVEDGINFLSNKLQDTVLDLFGAGTVVGDNTLIQVQSPWVGGVSFPFVIRIQNEDMVVRDNRFKLSTPPVSVIQQEAPLTVMGNDFSEVVNSTNGAILIDNANCIIVGNRFRFAPTTGPNLREVNGINYYDNNSQLFTNGGGGIVDPVIPIGNGSCVQGMLDFSGAASSGGGTSIRFRYRNPFGLAQVKGYIENTGANSWTLTETFITQNLGTFTRVTTPVVAGTKITLDPFDFTGVVGLAPNNYQVIEYRVSVTVLVAPAVSHVYFAAPDGITAA